MTEKTFYIDTEPKYFNRILIKKFRETPVKKITDRQVWGVYYRKKKKKESISIKLPLFQISDSRAGAFAQQIITNKKQPMPQLLIRKFIFLILTTFKLGIVTQSEISFTAYVIRKAPNPNRLKATAKNNDPLLESCFKSLLQEINEAYPEAQIKIDEETAEKPTAWVSTTEKLKQLKHLRNESKHDGRVTITKIKACNLVGIDSKTASKHDPELWKRWEDWEY